MAGETWARRLVAERAGGVCEGCGLRLDRGLGHSWAHRAPKGLGGLWVPSNGLALCGTGTTGCHGWAEHHPLHAQSWGWRVVQGEPRDAPCLIYTQAYLRAWVLLDDDGCLAWVENWSASSLDTPT